MSQNLPEYILPGIIDAVEKEFPGACAQFTLKSLLLDLGDEATMSKIVYNKNGLTKKEMIEFLEENGYKVDAYTPRADGLFGEELYERFRDGAKGIGIIPGHCFYILGCSERMGGGLLVSDIKDKKGEIGAKMFFERYGSAGLLDIAEKTRLTRMIPLNEIKLWNLETILVVSK